MARNARYSIRHEDGESDDVAKMTAEEEQEQLKIYVMREDLGLANANRVKFGEEARQGPPLFVARRQCDRDDTEEAKIASQNKSKLAGWTSFHTIIDDADLPNEQPRNLHSHRAGVAHELRLAAIELGFNSVDKLGLNDTYTNQGAGQRGGNTSFSARGSRHGAPSRTPPLRSNRFDPMSTAMRGRVKPSNTSGTKPHVSMTRSGTRRVDMPAGGQLTPKAARTKATVSGKSQSWNDSLSTPSAFMSAAATKKATEILGVTHKSSKAAVVNGGQDIVTASPVEAAQGNAGPQLGDPAIRRVPVEEFSFHAVGTLAPGDISTLTDGAPTPASLSGFSTSTGVSEQVPVQAESRSNGLVGLGIGNVDFDDASELLEAENSLTVPAPVVSFSPSGSIMDSPILDDVKSEVLATAPGSILEIAGRKYMAVDDLLAIRDAIDKKIHEANLKAGGISGLNSSSERDTPPTLVETAKPLSIPSSTTTTSEATTVITAGRPNPFAVREPLATNDANISLAPAITAEVEKSVRAAEPVKTSSTRRPAPFSSSTNISSKWGDDQPAVATKNDIPAVEPTKPSTNSRPAPFTSKTQVSSKWGGDQPAALTKNDVPAIEPATHLKIPRAAPFTSNTQVSSKWANEPAATPLPAPVRIVMPARPRSPIIGDRNVFGHLSEEARKGQQYTPPHPKGPAKQKAYLQPGDGYKQLVERITGLKVADTVKK